MMRQLTAAPGFGWVLAIAAAAAVGLALITGTGTPVAVGTGALRDGMFGTPYAIGNALNAAAVLALVAVGFTIAHRAGLVNVGGEGQIAAGGIAATLVGVALPDAWPPAAGVPLTLAAGFVGGAVWALGPAVLRSLRDTSEVITTLLMNFVGAGLVALCVHEESLLRQPITSAATLPQSAPLAPSARLPLLGPPEAQATAAILVAAAAVLVALVVTRWTVTGTRLVAVGRSVPAARRLGLPVARLQVAALCTAGGLAGIAGATLVATVPFVLKEGFTAGFGFAGLVVGLLAGRSIAAVAAIALAFGFLASGGINLQIAAGVPASSVQIVQSVLIIVVAGAAILRERGTS
ncbi:MAG TPA: hypothetical protein VM575_07640 [Nocardioides sp.]|nr:hypothetical protein [Nocardioides sp.]